MMPSPFSANTGWAAVSYLIAGIAVWGFVGWLVDQWLDLGGIATGIGWSSERWERSC